MASSFIAYAVAVIYRNDSRDTILLAHRSATGFMDRSYSLIGGKIENGELPREALARELNEEIGIIVQPSELSFAHALHLKSFLGDSIALFFTIGSWQGEPYNRESSKHDQIAWWDINKLPDTLMPTHKQALQHIQDARPYSEFSLAEAQNS
jgi:8-oxo-dGTP diphosphatase